MLKIIITSFSILILLALVLHCCIAIVMSYSQAGKQWLHNIPQNTKRQLIDDILQYSKKFFCFFVGTNWKSWSNLCRLALCYYIFLPNLMFFRSAESLLSENWQFSAPFINMAIMNLWIITNLIGDYISYNVSRDLIDSYLKAHQKNTILILKTVIKDLCVAFALLTIVVISTNLYHFFYTEPGLKFTMERLVKYIFDIQNHGADFSLVIKGKRYLSFPGLAIVSFSTFFPTIFWAVALIFSLITVPIRTWSSVISNEISDYKNEASCLFNYRVKYLTFLTSAIGGLFVIMKFNAG